MITFSQKKNKEYKIDSPAGSKTLLLLVNLKKKKKSAC